MRCAWGLHAPFPPKELTGPIKLLEVDLPFYLKPLFFWGRALILIVVECIIIFLSEKLSFGDSHPKATICNKHSAKKLLTLLNWAR